MSFVLDLYATPADWAQAERAAAATAVDGHLAVLLGPRKRWGRTLKPSLHFDWAQAQAVLSDDADWDHEAFTLSSQGRQRLAKTVQALVEALGPGWGIRAYWVGDRLDDELTLSATDLLELVERSQLDRGTLYRVSSKPAG